ncbi:hypothetical protein MAR_025307 [Mya arenaria]|uniref:Transmembrane protein n=1 Tax=Mya arenaria TaxID=6604 RepID=A0ABY7DT97_MYAAR|nr:uncharacterized protein LOC128228391 [Mya arenaria]WAR00935.1 hypothetical protein MAR_025307 [Mya arenaria]
MRREVYILLFLGFVAVCARSPPEDKRDHDDCECNEDMYHHGDRSDVDARDDSDSHEDETDGHMDWETMTEEEKRELMRRKHEHHEENRKCCEHHWGKKKIVIALAFSSVALVIIAVVVGYCCYRKRCKKNCKTTPDSKYKESVSQILSVPPVETVSGENKYPLPEGDIATSGSPPPPYTTLPGHGVVLVSPPPYQTYPTTAH